MTDAVKVQVLPTLDRSDANGEYFIRLCPEVLARLEASIEQRRWWSPFRKLQQLGAARDQVRYVIVEGPKDVPASWLSGPNTPHRFRIVAAVRRVRDCSCRDGMHQARLDMTIRDAVGARTLQELKDAGKIERRMVDCGYLASSKPKEDPAGIVGLAPLNRSIRPGWLASLVGYQWEVCRSRQSFPGDMETPVCKTDSGILQNLGLPDGGVVVIESARKRVIRRLLPVSQRQIDAAIGLPRRVTGNTPYNDLNPASDFDSFLGVTETRKMPPIHIDLKTRTELGIVPGECVWIRREERALLRTALSRLASAMLLTVIVLLIREPTVDSRNYQDAILIVSIVGLIAVLFWLALRELKDSVRSS